MKLSPQAYRPFASVVEAHCRIHADAPCNLADNAASDEEIPLELLLDTLPVPVFYKNRQGLYIGCNEAFENFFGCTKEQIVGEGIFDLNPRRLAGPYSSQIEALSESRSAEQYESKILNAHGVVRDILLNKAVFTNEQGEPTGVIGTVLDITERKQTERKLKEALEFAEGIITAIPDILFEVNRDGRYLQVWTKNPELLAQQKEALIGKTVNDVLAPDQAAIAMDALREADENGVAYGRCLRITLPNGETRWFEQSVAKRSSSAPSTGMFLVLSRDITERKQQENTINEVRTHLLSMLQTIPDMVWMKDANGSYLLCNHAFGRLVGKVESEIVGKTDYDLFDIVQAPFFRKKDQEAIHAGRVVISEEWTTHYDNRQRILLETRRVPVIGAEGEVTGVLGVARDITELHASREKIYQMAFYDTLTSLPNRALFYDRLQQVITDTIRSNQLAGVILIDIDRFKTVNDTMGHPTGDELLCQAARRLTASVRGFDAVTRLGGDEFAILLPDISDDDKLGPIADRILRAFNEPFLLDGREVFVSCSIGIARCPEDSTDPDDLMQYADSAMYLAKRSGRGSYRFYSKELTASARERMLVESELRRAIERCELQLHYQPKVLLGNSAMIGSEALLRWHHREMGMIPPVQFIPIAEDTGLIVELGRWVLREACRTATELNSDGLPIHKMAINLSVKQFQSPGLEKTIAEILDETDCRPEWIEIEITESLLLDNKDETLQTLTALRAMGITIAIDDFGTGYSGLSYLARYPIDTLKIDRSFINSADGRNVELVKAILSIARCLGQKVVAEGVETVEQAAFLAAQGCDAAQGFLYSKALTKKDIIGLWQKSLGANSGSNAAESRHAICRI